MKIILNSLKLGALAALASIPTFAFANIGDTYKQSCDRYGQPDKTGNASAHWIIDNNNSITETFAPNGVCDAIWYDRFDKAFTGDELLSLIAFNIPSTQTFSEYPVKMGRFWQTPTGSRTVLLMIRDNHGEGRNPIELSIWTKGHHERLAQKSVPPSNQPVVDVDGSSI